MAATEMVEIQSIDDKTFEVPKSSLRLSDFFASIPTVDDEPLRTIDVFGVALAKVAEYMNEYATKDPVDLATVAKQGEHGIEPDEFEKHITAWDANFLASMDDVLFIRVLLAANSLGIESLYDLCCCKASLRMRNKIPEEIREEFRLQEPFEEDVYNRLLDENKWSTKPVQQGAVGAVPAAAGAGAGAAAGAGAGGV